MLYIQMISVDRDTLFMKISQAISRTTVPNKDLFVLILMYICYTDFKYEYGILSFELFDNIKTNVVCQPQLTSF